MFGTFNAFGADDRLMFGTLNAIVNNSGADDRLKLGTLKHIDNSGPNDLLKFGTFSLFHFFRIEKRCLSSKDAFTLLDHNNLLVNHLFGPFFWFA